jgi:hypothetical protein
MHQRLRPFRTVFLAQGITILQIAAVLIVASPSKLKEKWLSLFRWDSDWYLAIVSKGYVSTLPPVAQNGELSNVAFFPGYPLFSRVLVKLTGCDPKIVMLLVSQFCCFLFWYFFLRIMNKFRFGQAYQIIAVLGVMLFPTSFYLTAAYAESMFIAALLAFLEFGYSRIQKSSLILAGCAGAWMTATRIFGVPVAVVFILQKFITSCFNWMRKLTAWKRPGRFRLDIKRNEVLLSGLALSGAGLFFLYCYYRWGIWNLYQQTQRIGWGVEAVYSAIFKPELWRLEIPDLKMNVNDIDVNRLSGFLTIFYSWILLGLLLMEKGIHDAFGLARFLVSRRFPLYFAAVAMQVLAVSGLYTMALRSMSRYLLPIHVLIILQVLSLFKKKIDYKSIPVNIQTSLILLLILLLGVSVWVQVLLIQRFTSGQWVA